MTRKNNHNRREHRIRVLQRIIEEFKSEGRKEITAPMVHHKILELNSDEATIREIANRLRCWQKRLNIRPKGREYRPAPKWHGGDEKMTVYKIL